MSVLMPDRLQVGPFSFAVTVDPGEVSMMLHDRSDGRLAETDTSRLKIVINAGLPRDQIRDSMLHEALHAIIYVAGGWTKGISEEQAVARFGSLLLDTLQRNPALVAYLLAGDEA